MTRGFADASKMVAAGAVSLDRIVGRCWNSWCDGMLECKRPTHPKANVRCQKCGSAMYRSNWLQNNQEMRKMKNCELLNAGIQTGRIHGKFDAFKSRLAVESVRIENVGGYPVLTIGYPPGYPTNILTEHVNPESLKATPPEWAEETLKDNKFPRNQLFVLFGFGCGYLAETILSKLHHSSRLLVIEPEAPIFLAAMNARKLTRILTDGRAYFIIGDKSPSTIRKQLKALFVGQPCLNVISIKATLPAIALSKINEELSLYVFNTFTAERSYTVTLNIKRDEWTRNLIKNFSDGQWDNHVGKLKDRYRGSVCICGSGPTLEESAKLIPDRAFIIAVDTAVPFLLKNGLVPMSTVCVDSELDCFEMATQGDRTPNPKQGFVVAGNAHPNWGKYRPADWVYWIWPPTLVACHNMETMERMPFVGGTACELAKFMGFSELNLFGFDFAFKGTKTHCEGMPEETQKLYRNLTGESAAAVKWESSVLGNDGKQHPTRPAFVTYLLEFEEWVKRNPVLSVNNLCGLAKIKNTGNRVSSLEWECLGGGWKDTPPFHSESRYWLPSLADCILNRPAFDDFIGFHGRGVFDYLLQDFYQEASLHTDKLAALKSMWPKMRKRLMEFWADFKPGEEKS
jgi:uncharacterized Rossmann fold enzyme